MSPDLGVLAPPPRPRRRPTVGTCRICGCTDAEACILENGHGAFPSRTCSWVERDLCSRCHSPRRPTRRQAGELQRIRHRVGPYTLAAGRYPGELVLTLLEAAPRGWRTEWQGYRELRMAPDGTIGEQRPRGGSSIERDARRAMAREFVQNELRRLGR